MSEQKENNKEETEAVTKICTEATEGTREEAEQVSMTELVDLIQQQMEEKPKERSLEDMRTIGLYGDVEEEKIAEVIAGLLSLHYLGKPDSTEEGEEPTEGKPIDLYISTYGGSADDMGALVDVMGVVKKDCAIRTIGIGKVMSAGVLILASGTKGERMIGRNCRVMIHSVIAGNAGALHNLENELQEVKKMQEIYLDSLVSATKMTKKQLKSFMRRKTNVYLTAEEAIKYGIADKILE
jgi:ATP-dependent Clp endopeptidase proteolytic subunit ClpP